jgi:hypothetical protein
LKKHLNITDPLPLLNSGIRRYLFENADLPADQTGNQIWLTGCLAWDSIRKKLFILFILISLTGKAVAPDTDYLTIFKTPAIQPYAPLMDAIGIYETMGNTLAFNEFENAAGIFQIRQVRVDDYNHRTGNNYKLPDMFDYKISEKVFLYFADLAGPYRFEKIAKAWNGSGPRTEFYWQQIKTLLGE